MYTRKKKRLTAILILTTVIISTCGCKKEEEEKISIEVDVISPAVESIATTGEFVGTIESNEKVAITPMVSGKVTKKNFNVGDKVNAGDVLFTIDDKELKAAKKIAEASVKTAWADLEQKNALNGALEAEANETIGTLGTREYEVNHGVVSANNDVNAAKNNKYMSDAQLMMAMGSDDIPTMVEAYKNAQTNNIEMGAATGAAELARRNRDDFNNYSKNTIIKKSEAARIEGNAGVKASEAALLAANAELEKAQIELNNATITSPISGTIQVANVENYGLVSDQEVAYVIYSEAGRKVSFYVSSNVKNNMLEGQKVSFEKSGNQYEGVVTKIVNAIDPEKGLYRIEALISGEDFGDLSPDSKIKVTTNIAQAEQAITLPIDVVYYNNQQAFVYVAKDGKANKVNVETGIADKDNVQIISGLNPKDQIIKSWTSQIKDQADITIKADKEKKGTTK